MSENEWDERTEEPTPRKIEEAREKGMVAHSPDLSAAIVLLGGLVVLKLWGQYPLDALYQITRGCLGNMDPRTMGVNEVYAWFGACGLFLLRAMMPVIAGLLLVAFLGTVIQTGFLFSGEPLTLRFERMNPVAGVKRLVSKRGLVRLMAGLFKVTVVGLVAYFTIRGQLAAYVALTDASVGDIFAFVVAGTFDLGLKIGVALLALAILDFAYQKWQYLQDMRMTKQEVRDELKRMEGDPLNRDRRRRMQRTLVMQRMMHRVPAADVVVTGADDLAVALRYETRTMTAPVVVAKGRGHVAERIREIASENELPVVERDALAQALNRACNLGEQVPADLFGDVAEVLAFAYELNRMKAARAAGAA